MILGSNIACLSFSARAVLILEDSVAFFYSVLGPVGASMLRYHEEQVSVRSQHRRHQDASQVKIVAKKYKLGDHIYGVDCIYLTDIPSMSVTLCLVIKYIQTYGAKFRHDKGNKTTTVSVSCYIYFYGWVSFVVSNKSHIFIIK